MNHPERRWLQIRKRAGVNPSLAVTVDGRAQLRTMFDALDVDGSGVLELREIAAAARELGGAEYASQMLRDFHAGGLGAEPLSFERFAEFMLSGGRHARRAHARFFEFATRLQRRRLLRHVHDDDLDDSDRYEHFQQLLLVPMFPPEAQEGPPQNVLRRMEGRRRHREQHRRAREKRRLAAEAGPGPGPGPELAPRAPPGPRPAPRRPPSPRSRISPRGSPRAPSVRADMALRRRAVMDAREARGRYRRTVAGR